jgi:hypothetical protein
MPRSGNPAFPVINLVLVPFALFGVLLGALVLAAGAGGEIWWAFVGLIVGGLLMLGGAISNLVRWRRWARREEAAAASMAAVARARSADPAAPLPAPVVAHWTYAAGDWSAYASREADHRGGEALGLFLGMVLVGTPMLAWVKDVGWGIAFAVSLVVGAMMGGGKLLMALTEHRRNVATPGSEVVITPTAVLMNGRYHVLQDHQFRFRGARILEGERPQILELSIEMSSGSGPVPETYRIPIPAGREHEARAVARDLAARYAALNGGSI